MNANPLTLELMPIEPEGDVTPAVQPPADSGQDMPALSLVDPTPQDVAPAGLSLEAQSPPSVEEESLDLEIDVAPIEAPSTDRFRIAATTEFEKGEIDQPLWDRAFANAKGDRKAAIALYLPARATALRVLKREQKPTERPKPARSVDTAPAPPKAMTTSAWADDTPPGDFRRARFKALGIKIAAVVGVLVVVGVFVKYVYPGSESSATDTATGVAAAARPQPAKGSDNNSTSAPEANTKATAVSNLRAKIEELRLADNWNVLVLYAQEWTRQEPTNAAAWNQLTLGFEHLHQFADARDAATNAVKLSPKNAQYWRALGGLDQELDRPEDALKAFEQAAALDEKDLNSLVQAGVLNMQLARVAEAKIALSKALELNPEDAGALCLKSLVASGPIAPGQTTSARTAVYTGACRNGDAPKDSPVAANNAPQPKAAAVSKKR
jgi:Flp pilus assembly protein TadD